MNKLIEKHLLNGTGTGKFRLPNSDEIEARVNALMRNFHTQQPATVAESTRYVRENLTNQRREASFNRANREAQKRYSSQRNGRTSTPGARKRQAVRYNTKDPEDVLIEYYDEYPTPPVIEEHKVNPNINADAYRSRMAEVWRDRELDEKWNNQVLPTFILGVNHLMPSQIAGAIADDRPFLESWYEGNKGLGEIDETAGEGTNLLFDLVAPAAWSKGLKLINNPFVRDATKYMTTVRFPKTWLEYMRLGPVEFRINPNRMRMGFIPDDVRMAPTNKSIPEGYEYVRNLQLRGRDGIRNVTLVKEKSTGRFKILEDLPKEQEVVDLSRYTGERLTGNEPGFDEWARGLTPENDHFPDLSHGLNDSRDLIAIMNREFEALPNGSRVDLGETFSGDSSGNLLQYVYRHRDRAKMVLPEYDDVVLTNSYGIKGRRSADIFNQQLDRLLDHYGYSPDAVPRAVYNVETNTLTVPRLSFIKLHKNGNKLIKKWR